MFKLLLAVFNRLTALKNGIVTNGSVWTSQPDTPVALEAQLQRILSADAKVRKADVALREAQKEARMLAAELTAAANQTEHRAVGLHAATSARLADYGIQPEADISRRVRLAKPGKAVVARLTDDDDGQGFVGRIQRVEDAEYYEIERGQSAEGRPNEQPTELSFLRTTAKLRFLDDDVERGIRYWYRVRAVNRRGAGEWSETVSAIQ